MTTRTRKPRSPLDEKPDLILWKGTVLKLALRGLSVEDIARVHKLTPQQVQLILIAWGPREFGKLE